MPMDECVECGRTFALGNESDHCMSCNGSLCQSCYDEAIMVGGYCMLCLSEEDRNEPQDEYADC